MNRNEEYNELLADMENTPNELDDTVTRAQIKLKIKQRRRIISIGLTSITLLALLFTVLVNTSATIAYACGQIPLIKDLAQFVSFSPSLSAALENEYVQPIELEQTDADITARIEYVIVDQKQINIFYTLDSNIYSALDATPEIDFVDSEPPQWGYSISSSNFGEKNGELKYYTVDFTKDDIPSKLEFKLKIRDHGSYYKEERVIPDTTYNPNEEVYVEPEYITEFTFLLEFDPAFTAQGETITLNQTFEIDGQTLIITTVDIYPTHIRINLEDEESNTAWLTSLDYYIENEKGKRFDTISNGISATGNPENPMMTSYRLESTFFSNSKSLKLFIKKATWLDKDMERVKVDLKNKQAEVLPQYVEFDEATRNNDNWTLKFSSKRLKENAAYQLWGTYYYDEKGNKYTINTWMSDTSYAYNEETGENRVIPDRFGEVFTLYDYPYDVVYLSPCYSRIVELVSPIEIKVK